MDHAPNLLSLLKSGKRTKTMQLPQKSSSKGSALTFTSTLLEKRTPRDLGKRFVEFAHKSDRELSILYSRSC